MLKRGRPFGSKNTKLNKTFMLTLEHFPDLWQATLHFNGKSYSITEYINGIPQIASETCKLSIEFLDSWFRKS